MPDDFPFPTPFEILRLILRALDLKHSNKKLDDLVKKRCYDPRELSDFIEGKFSDEVSVHIGPDTARILTQCVNDFFLTHLLLTSEINADGVTRKEMLTILVRSYGKDHLAELLTQFFKTFRGPHPSTLCANDTRAVATALNWLAENQSGWSSYLANLQKEQKDRISAWDRGNDLPSSYTISLLDKAGDSSKLPSLVWQTIKTLLFIARAIDWIKGLHYGEIILDQARTAIWGANQNVFIDTEIKKIQRSAQTKLGNNLIIFAKLQNKLKRTAGKQNPDQYMEDISAARALTEKSDLQLTTGYWLDWHEARWNVYSGNLTKANQLYKLAHEDSLFRSGENQKKIIDESLVVAASLPNPDRVFLKHLKWSLINFYYDIPSVTGVSASNKFSDTIEDWEVMLWRNNFNKIFPKKGLFPEIHYDGFQTEIGPPVELKKPEFVPDYRHPNKKIKIGQTWKRKMPQLVWYAMTENFEICEELVNRGASVNVASEVGDTPILMALESLNILAGNRSLDDRFFQLFKQKKHTPNIINQRTQKKRLLPIISAVESGRTDLVEAVLGLGANPNLRGQTDEQSALNICMKIIGVLKNPELAITKQREQPDTLETLDSIRRNGHGLTGFTLEEQLVVLQKINEQPEFVAYRNKEIETRIENVNQHIRIDDMRKIAKLLISSGADVNAEHKSPLYGYTPFMLAAELDEEEIFQLMLANGGNVDKAYAHPQTGQEISLREISRHFKSDKIAKLLFNTGKKST